MAMLHPLSRSRLPLRITTGFQMQFEQPTERRLEYPLSPASQRQVKSEMWVDWASFCALEERCDGTLSSKTRRQDDLPHVAFSRDGG